MANKELFKGGLTSIFLSDRTGKACSNKKVLDQNCSLGAE